jgi:hypothetical protein
MIDTFFIVILISIGQSHWLREESVPCALGDVLLMMYIVSDIVLDQEFEGGFADGFFLRGMRAGVVRSVFIVGGGHNKYNFLNGYK